MKQIVGHARRRGYLSFPLRDVQVPLLPAEGLQADRDALDQEPPLDNTLQENNNASMEEVPPPHPFPEEGNEETVTEVPAEHMLPLLNPLKKSVADPVGEGASPLTLNFLDLQLKRLTYFISFSGYSL